MQIVIDIPQPLKEAINIDAIPEETVAVARLLINAVKNGIVIPENARNGDVLSLMMFKDMKGNISHLLEIDDYDRTTLEKEWLNAPYKK